VAHNCHSKRITVTSRQKENLTAKRKRLMAKRITSQQKEKPLGKKKKTHGKKKTSR